MSSENLRNPRRVAGPLAVGSWEMVRSLTSILHPALVWQGQILTKAAKGKTFFLWFSALGARDKFRRAWYWQGRRSSIAECGVRIQDEPPYVGGYRVYGAEGASASLCPGWARAGERESKGFYPLMAASPHGPPLAVETAYSPSLRSRFDVDGQGGSQPTKLRLHEIKIRAGGYEPGFAFDQKTGT